jgi:hypothetical protein
MKSQLRHAILKVNFIFSSFLYFLVEILCNFGPFSVLLLNRIEKISKANEEEMFDLCMVNVKGDGLKFI